MKDFFFTSLHHFTFSLSFAIFFCLTFFLLIKTEKKITRVSTFQAHCRLQWWWGKEELLHCAIYATATLREPVSVQTEINKKFIARKKLTLICIWHWFALTNNLSSFQEFIVTFRKRGWKLIFCDVTNFYRQQRRRRWILRTNKSRDFNIDAGYCNFDDFVIISERGGHLG